MTVIEPYTAECSECGYSETRMGLMSFNSMVGIPEGLIEEHPVGCPKCGDVGFDVYDEEDEDANKNFGDADSFFDLPSGDGKEQP